LSKASQIRQRAQEYLRKGNINKAIDEYKRLVGVENKNPNLFNELGDVFLRSGDRVQAVSNYDKAIVNYEKVALYNNAVAVCKKILRIIPNRVETIFKLGELRAKQKLDGEAVSYFSKFMDVVLADSTSPVDGLTDKLDVVLEYYEKNEMLCTKAAELYSMYGLKSKAAEIYVKLAAEYKSAGNEERERYYIERYESLKKDLEENEIADFETMLQGGLETDNNIEDVSESEGDEPGATEEVSDDATTEEGKGEIEQSVTSVTGEQTGEAISSNDGNESPSVEEIMEETEIISAIEDSEVSAEDGMKEGIAEAGDETVSQDVLRDDDSRTESVAEKEAKDTPFSSAMDDGGIGSVKGQSDGLDGLAEDITSDVEEEDHKSHYDLGMAYLEMGLYTEAVKEFQTASRSDSLNLQCMEMIGYCFIKQNQPRLAVKQLERALNISKNGQADDLGIHYNLGIAYEMLGDVDRAKEHFEEVYIVDMAFRDVEEKIKKYSTVT